MAKTSLYIVLLPVIAFLVQVFFGKRLPRQGDWVSVAAIVGAFILVLPIFGSLLATGSAYDTLHYTWISLPISVTQGLQSIPAAVMPDSFDIRIGVLINNPTAIMLFMVTLCSSLIHIFSTGYMKGEERYHLFFAYISLFSAAMLGLLISDNLITFFICWELMGLCSYLLIGFYYKKHSAINAGLKAFMTTRVGDVGFFLGILGIFATFGTSNFEAIYQAIANHSYEGKTLLGMPALEFIGFMILMGAAGKSAQFPLHVWLPDAMEGPTPVSALIHAATMVAAGVFLLLRMYPLLDASHVVLTYVAYVGAFTAFFAALLAIVQIDIKKVLAYSTISQLGYMVMGVGVGAFAAGFLHLITHAFFKACLFMCAGSVIHAVHTNDMREMGGLKSKMPWTFLAMLIATLSISGLPFFSGFVSKDRILAGALAYGMEHPMHFIIPVFGFSAAALTAFYMFRLIFMTFFGAAKDEHKHEHAHEQPWSMVVPVLVLAALSLSIWFAGPTGIEAVDKIFPVHWFDSSIELAQKEAGIALHHGDPGIHHTAHVFALILSLALALSGIFFSSLTYLKRVISADAWKKRLAVFYNVLWNLYYFDYLYITVFIQNGLLKLNRMLARFDDRFIDRILVDGWRDVVMVVKSVTGKFDEIVIDRILVDGSADLANAGGWVTRRLQTGRVQQYLVLVLVSLGVFFFLLWR